MMKYADSVNGEIAFVSPELTNTLGDYLSAQRFKNNYVLLKLKNMLT